MSDVLPDDIEALRNALELSGEASTVSLTLTRTSAEKVLELLEAEKSTGAVIVPVKDLFTSTEAAGMLGMSRPTLVKLLDAGEIEHVRVGTHRRVPMRAIAAYQRKRQEDHAEALSAAKDFQSNISFGGKH